MPPSTPVPARTLLLVLVAALALAPDTASSAPIVMTFDERLLTEADGLSVLGVTFDVVSLDPAFPDPVYFGERRSFFNENYLDEEALHGEPFVTPGLAFEFDAPTSTLEFGVGLQGRFNANPEVTVELFDAALNSLGSIPVMLSESSEEMFEALFQYAGTSVSRALLHFPGDEPSGAFFVDGLTFENAAVNLVRAQGANGAAGANGPTGGPGAPGGGALAIAASGDPIEHAVARGGSGGAGGTGTTGSGGNGGAGGTADARATAVAAGGGDASATAVARAGNGSVGGAKGSGSTAQAGGTGAGGNATGTAIATSSSGDAAAIVEVVGGAGSFRVLGSPTSGAGGTATGSARATSTQGGDATASVRALGGNGGGSDGRDGLGAGDGGDVALVNAVDGSTSGALRLTQEAVGGFGGASDRQGAAGAGGDALSSLTRSVSTATFELRSRAFGGLAGYPGGAGASTGSPSPGGRAEARADATNDAGSVWVELVATGGEGADSRGSVAPGAGGDALLVARGETLGDGQGVTVGSDASAAKGGDGGWRNASGIASGAGGNATSQSTGIARGDSEVAVMDRAIGGHGGRPMFGTGSGGSGGAAASTAAGESAGSSSVSVESHAAGGEGGMADGAGRTTGDGGSATARADGTSLGSGDVDVTATATGGESGFNFTDSTTLTGENGGAGGIAEARASGSSQTGDVTVSAYQTGGRGGTVRDGGRSGDGADSNAIDAVDGATSGILTLIQSATGGSGGGYVSAQGPGGNAGDALSNLTAANPLGGELRLDVRANGGDGGVGAIAGLAGTATSHASGSSASEGVLVSSYALGGSAGISLSGGAGVSGGAAHATAYGAASTSGSSVSATAVGGAERPLSSFNKTTSSLGGDAQAFANSTGATYATADAMAYAGHGDSTGISGLGIARADATGVAGWANAEAYADSRQAMYLTARARTPVASAASAESRAAVARAADARPEGAGLDAFSFVTGLPVAADAVPALVGNPLVSSHVPPSKALAMGAIGFAPDQEASTEPLTTELFLTLVPAKMSLDAVIGIGFLDPETTGTFGALHVRITRNAVAVIDRVFTDEASADAFFDDQFVALANGGFAAFETFGLELAYSAYETGSAFSVDYLIASVPEPDTAPLLALGLALLARRRRA